MSLSLDGINPYGNYNMDTTSTGKLEETLNSDLSKATDDELMSVCRED